MVIFAYMHILGLLYNAGNIYKNIDRVKWLFGQSHFGIKNLVVLGVDYIALVEHKTDDMGETAMYTYHL